jgi:hypothetical protein
MLGEVRKARRKLPLLNTIRPLMRRKSGRA